MTPRHLIDSLEDLAEAPGGIERLRGLVLELAVRGVLVSQDERDGTADHVVERSSELKVQAITQGAAPNPRGLPGKPTHPPELHEVPDTWTWALLDDLCVYIQRGKSPKYDDGSPIRVVSQKCVQWSGFELSKARGVKPETLVKYGPERFLRSGDVLWNSTGTGTVGRVNVFPGAEGMQVVADSHVTVIRPASVHPHYVYIWLRSPSVQVKIDEMTSGSTNQQELNTSTVRLQPVPVPPIPEQNRIVAKVDALMDLLDRLEAARDSRETTRVALRDAALAALRDADSGEEVEVAWQRIAERMDDLFTDPADVEPLRQTVLQLAVRGRLVPQDRTDEPASELLDRCPTRKQELIDAMGGRKQRELAPPEPDELLYEAPVGWSWVRLDACFYVSGGLQKSGKRRPVKNTYPYLRVANVQRGSLDLREISEFELFEGELERYRLKPGDLLIVEGNGSEKEIGRCARWSGEIEDCVHQNHLIRCRPLYPAAEEFAQIFLNSPSGVHIMKSLAVTTSGLYNLSVGKIRRIVLPVPPLAEQRRIVAKVDALMSLVDELAARLEAVRSLHSALAAAAVHQLDP